MANMTDKEILNAIFNPLLPHGELVYDEDLSQIEETDDDSDLSKSAKELELEGVKLAESGNMEGALKMFTRAIEIAPSRASAYNNRAQALRLMGKAEDAEQDLNKAIELSQGKGRAACQAFCQRGLIRLKDNKPDLAKLDFEEASKLGSQFAKAQLVQLNPYAALCNKMLRDVFAKVRNGESVNEDQQQDEKK